MDPSSTKARLLEAAAQVFLEHGFGLASMDLVRQQAGVSNGSLYHHFPTKAQLADALYAWTLRDFHATVLVPIAGRASAQSGVKGMVRAYVQWVEQNPDGARLLHELRRGGALTSGGERDSANSDGFGALAGWIAARVEAGEMRALPLPVWTAVVFAPAISMTPHWVSQPGKPVSPKVRQALEHAAWMAVAPD